MKYYYDILNKTFFNKSRKSIMIYKFDEKHMLKFEKTSSDKYVGASPLKLLKQIHGLDIIKGVLKLYFDESLRIKKMFYRTSNDIEKNEKKQIKMTYRYMYNYYQLSAKSENFEEIYLTYYATDKIMLIDDKIYFIESPELIYFANKYVRLCQDDINKLYIYYQDKPQAINTIKPYRKKMFSNIIETYDKMVLFDIFFVFGFELSFIFKDKNINYMFKYENNISVHKKLFFEIIDDKNNVTYYKFTIVDVDEYQIFDGIYLNLFDIIRKEEKEYINKKIYHDHYDGRYIIEELLCNKQVFEYINMIHDINLEKRNT